jgi:electron transfer flavoprotein beta subunit
VPLKIAVCIKQVPDPEYFDRIAMDPETGAIIRSGIPAVTNLLDRHALEEALRIRERYGGSVTVLTMGPPQARKCLEEALATGADRGMLLCDPAFAGADTLVTARVLAAGIQTLQGCDMILCGNESADGATGQLPAQLAFFLGLPCVTYVRNIQWTDERRMIVERTVEDGCLKVDLRLPAVIAVLRKINQYRLPTVMGIMEAISKEIVEHGCAICEGAGLTWEEFGGRGSPTRVAGVFEPAHRRKVEMIEGEPQDIAKKLIRKLHESDVL